MRLFAIKPQPHAAYFLSGTTMQSHHPTFAYPSLRTILLLGIAVLVAGSQNVSAQINPADGPWSGQIQCQLDVQQQGYVRHETQTWTLTSRTPATKSGDISIYSASWTATGQGGFQRVLGTRSSLAQWNVNVPPANTAIAMFVRAQDKQFIIRIWQRSAPSYTGISAVRQLAENGVPQRPANISSAVHEWTLPWIQPEPRETTRGKFSVATESLGADLTPPGAAPTAECTYQFTRTASGNTATASGGGQSTKGAAADSQSGAGNTSDAGASAKYETNSSGGEAAGAKGAGDFQSGAADASGAAASAKYSSDSLGGAGAKGAGDSPSGADASASTKNDSQAGGAAVADGASGKGGTAADASITASQKGSAAGSAGGAPGGIAGKAGSNPMPPGDGNTPIPTDTAGSNSSNSQTCSLSDIASMYDRAGQNIEIIFAKLTKEAQTAKSALSEELPKESLSALAGSGEDLPKENVSGSAASRAAQATEQIKSLDQAIAQIATAEEGALQEVTKAKQKALEQIAKAPTDAERNDACQAAQSAATQLMTTVESEANALDAGISSAGGGSSGSVQAGNSEGTPPLQSGGVTAVRDRSGMQAIPSSTTNCGTSAGHQGAVSDLGSHTFSTAKSLQVIPGGNIRWTGNLLSGNDANYFTIRSSTSVSATVQLSGLDCGSDFDLYVYRYPGGPVVASATVRGVSSKQVVVDLDGTGLYPVVRAVTWNSASPSYQLTVTAASAAAGASADATPEPAAPVAVTSQGPAVHGAPEGTPQTSTAIRDRLGMKSLSSNTTNCGASAGNQGAISDLGSHTFSAAIPLQVVPGGNIRWTGNLLSENDANYFAIRSSTTVSATVQLSGLDCGSDFDLYVYSSPGVFVTSSTVRGVSSKQLVVDLAGAGLFLVVRAVTWNSARPSYQLTVTATTPGVH